MSAWSTTEAPEDLGGIQNRVNQTADDSLESTRRMADLVDESAEAGKKTLVDLDRQGEQLDNVERGLDEIDRDMTQTEQHLDGLGKWLGLCLPCWKRGRSGRKSSCTVGKVGKEKKKDGDGGVVNYGNDQERIIVPGDDDGSGPSTGGYVTRITNDGREDEMERNMAHVNDVVGNLKDMAEDMNIEISDQNKQMDKIVEKAESNQDRVRKADKRAKQLLED